MFKIEKHHLWNLFKVNNKDTRQASTDVVLKSFQQINQVFLLLA